MKIPSGSPPDTPPVPPEDDRLARVESLLRETREATIEMHGELLQIRQSIDEVSRAKSDDHDRFEREIGELRIIVQSLVEWRASMRGLAAVVVLVWPVVTGVTVWAISKSI